MIEATLSLAQFINELAVAVRPERYIKDVLLKRHPGCLQLASGAEVAQLLAFLVAMVHADNGQATIRMAMVPGASGDEQDRLWMDAFSKHRFRSVTVNRKGKVLRSPQNRNAPALEFDAAKTAAELSAPWSAVAELDLAAYVESAAFRAAKSSICSHPVKINHGRGSGGFTKRMPGNRENVPMMVTEEDFLTAATQTLACSAKYHREWHVLLPWIDFNGCRKRLPALLSDDRALREAVCASFKARHVEGTSELLRALTCTTTDRPAIGESQVYAGDLPHAPEQPSFECLSVFAPYAMHAEMADAKDRLSAAYRAEVESALQQLSSDIEAVDEQLKTLKAAKPTALHGPATDDYKRRLRALSEQRTKLRAQEAAWKGRSLHIREIPTLLGGTVPRNLVLDAEALQTANVRLNVPFIRQAAVDIDAAVAYVERARLQDVNVPYGEHAPRCLLPNATTKRYQDQRRMIFVEMALEALAPLTALRDRWRARWLEHSQEHMQERDVVHIGDADGAWQLFVVGDADMSPTEAAAMLRPLAKAVAAKVAAALDKAYRAKPWSSEYAAEVLQTAMEVVTFERG